MNQIILFLGILALGILAYACRPKNKKSEANSVSVPIISIEKPIFNMELPNSIHEISGLASLNDTTLLAHNDENGTVWAINTQTKEITEFCTFKQKGDYEGIEYMNHIVYLMESDGTLRSYNTQSQEYGKVSAKHKDVKEFEGLASNPQKNRLILMAKKASKKEYLFEFEPDTQELKAIKLKDPAFWETLRGSGLTYFNGYYLALSAAKHSINIVSEIDYSIVKSVALSIDLLPQAEGICISPNGKTLYVASEGSLFKNATLMAFAIN
jgi:uncharacterized protein YjiK